MSKLKHELTGTFDDVLHWFDLNDELLYRVPADGGWNVAEILEHISLTNHYLLILIRKGALKALEQSRLVSYRDLLNGYDIDWDRMELIGQHDAFVWDRPEHMVPSGKADLATVKDRLLMQEQECLLLLDDLKDGQGVLYKTMMSVNGLGKIDVYHYVYFLVLHARRHLTQMEKCLKS